MGTLKKTQAARNQILHFTCLQKVPVHDPDTIKEKMRKIDKYIEPFLFRQYPRNPCIFFRKKTVSTFAASEN